LLLQIVAGTHRECKWFAFKKSAIKTNRGNRQMISIRNLQAYAIYMADTENVIRRNLTIGKLSAVPSSAN